MVGTLRAARTKDNLTGIHVTGFNISDRGYLDTAATPIGIGVSAGTIPGYSGIHKFGWNPDIGTGNLEPIWDYSTDYVFTQNTGSIYFISSSNNTDTQDIEILGLDENFAEKTVTQTLNGSESLELSGSWTRVHRVKNMGATVLLGSVFIYEPDTTTAGVPDSGSVTIRAVIIPRVSHGGHNQSLMSIYTIPASKTGYMMKWYTSINRSSGAVTEREADMMLYTREYGGVFLVKDHIGLNNRGGGTFVYEYPIPLRLPEKTDIIIKSVVTSDNTVVSGGFDILLINN